MLARFLFAECYLQNRGNGGTVILWRSLHITTIVIVCTLVIREILLPDRSMGFDIVRLRLILVEAIPWYGAVFGAVYALLYTRFSSQSVYLTQFYNQIIESRLTMKGTKDANRIMHIWQAAYIEDAEDLHLALKPGIASLIRQMLQDKEIRKCFEKTAPGGAVRLVALANRVEKAWCKSERRFQKHG